MATDNLQESSELDFRKEWFPIEEFDAGGGGKVYRCIKISLIDEFKDSLNIAPKEAKDHNSARLIDQLYSHLIARADAVAAVKVPHESTALPRFQREIQAMKSCKHPALISLFNHGPMEQLSWFAMQYHPNGNLTKHSDRYRGNPLETLEAIRPVIESVAELHKKGFIHRDIKPKNIFVSSSGHLILGDLGVAFPLDGHTERLTEMRDPPFSRDWIPDWIRFSDDPPEQKVDVFMLGKVMYFMVAGRNVLASQLNKPANNLVELFREVPAINQFQALLKKCVVADDDDCEPKNAIDLLELVDEVTNEVTGRARTQMIFNWLSNHRETDIPIRQAGHESDNYPSLKNLAVFFPFNCKRLLMQVRATDNGPVHVGVSIDNAPPQMIELKLPFNPYRGVWSDEIRQTFGVPITRGWHTVKIVVQSISQGSLTGVILYAE